MKSIHTKEQTAFVARLRQAREAAGLTQIDAAKKLKRSQSYVSKIESGELKVGVVELKQISNIYKKDIGFFLK